MPTNDDLTAEEREYQPLIQHLQQMYNTRLQDEHDLKAIRQQLSQTSLRVATSRTPRKAFSRTLDEENLGRIVHPPRFPFRNSTSWSRSLGMVAATLVVVLLTGSFVALLLLARSHPSVATRQTFATSTGSSLGSTPCHQSYPITGTISTVTFSTSHPHEAFILVKGPKEQFRGLLGETFVVALGPNTHLFEQQENGCHAVSLASLRAGQRIQLSPPQEILQSSPSQLIGVNTLVLLPPSR